MNLLSLARAANRAWRVLRAVCLFEPSSRRLTAMEYLKGSCVCVPAA
jgi:hypothetical protein